ncbi:hypothetical protein ANCCAN_06366 [Ancylostoma caninum]|uniref:Uncharacterized protein n=1 Tax=Ancylostoma caninum TaxID=29170 RepID=A0A368GT93_ANCCA|nr:hypothetical protein ANCCAN_06366 [Ancylostoma caninum]
MSPYLPLFESGHCKELEKLASSKNRISSLHSRFQ